MECILKVVFSASNVNDLDLEIELGGVGSRGYIGGINRGCGGKCVKRAIMDRFPF